MPYYNLSSRLTVSDSTGKGIIFNHISSAEITRSVKDLAATAKVVIPRRTNQVRSHSRLKEESVLTFLRPGYRVKLELGYNDELETEFEGYIREVQSGAPIVLLLDDMMYPLRKGKLLTMSWASTTLRNVLQFILPDYKMDCPDLTLTDWQINKKSPYSALLDLKDRIGFYARIDSVKKQCECYWAYSFKTNDRHTYHFQRNVKKSALKYVRKEDAKVRIEAVAPLKTGKKIRLTVGSNDNDARTISRNFNFVSDAAELKKLAESEADKLSYDGYSGTITGFGIPRTQAGDSLMIIDEKEKEREGVYLIEQVLINYSKSGYQRTNTLSFKL